MRTRQPPAAWPRRAVASRRVESSLRSIFCEPSEVALRRHWGCPPAGSCPRSRVTSTVHAVIVSAMAGLAYYWYGRASLAGTACVAFCFPFDARRRIPPPHPSSPLPPAAPPLLSAVVNRLLSAQRRYYDIWDGDFVWGSELPLIRHTAAVAVGYLALDTCLCLYAKEIREFETFAHHGAMPGGDRTARGGRVYWLPPRLLSGAGCC